MIGCFNISLYSVFDIHSIFDLMTFSMWDFMLWWFDLDLMMFDFSMDFMLCLSFLFMFLMNFFMKMIFSFMSNFMMMNMSMYMLDYIYLYLNLMKTLLFLYIMNVGTFMKQLDFYMYVLTIIHTDFTSLSDFTLLSNMIKKYMLPMFNFTFMLFYFTMLYMYMLHLLIMKFFFSKNYYTNLQMADNHITCNINNLKVEHLMNALLVYKNYIHSKSPQIYTVLNIMNLNIMLMSNMLILFLVFQIMKFTYINKNFMLMSIKNNKILYSLHVVFGLSFYSNYFSNMTFLYLINYIMFTFNTFTMVIKDFMHMSMHINIFNTYFLFNNKNMKFNMMKNLYNKKQLNYLIIT